MVLRKASAVLAMTLAVGGAYWIGCGDDDGDGGAVFFGDVSSVSSASVSISEPRPSFARRLLSPRLAWAQNGTCDAPSDGNLLFCVNEICTIVEGDCEFSESVGIDDGPVTAVLSFVDDEDGDGEKDAGEDDSIVTQNLSFCDGDQVQVDNAAVNFTTGITSATVTKVVDNCSGGGGTTRTPTGGTGSGTPTRTPTVTPTGGAGGSTPTRTPTTYSYGAMMNDAPGTGLVFLASLGVIGLLVPKRRRRGN